MVASPGASSLCASLARGPVTSTLFGRSFACIPRRIGRPYSSVSDATSHGGFSNKFKVRQMNQFDQIMDRGFSNDSQGLDAAIHAALTLGRQLYGATTT